MSESPLAFPPSMQGQRVDAALAALYPEFSRTQLTQALKAGKILINGEKLAPKTKIQGEETITFTEALLSEPHDQALLPQAIPLDICYEDEALLVLNKPAGLTVHPGAGQADMTLVNGLLYHDPSLSQLPRAGIVHRLDKETTGLLLVAKTAQSYQHLGEQMRERSISRAYLALAQGKITTPNTITTAYGRDARNRLKMAVKREGKTAITHYKPHTRFAHFTLLDIALQTGRTHQIRVHLAHIKHPIVGDPLYGRLPALPKNPEPALVDALKTFPRQALHAYRLVFTHPSTGERLTLEAPIPEDFSHLLETLSLYDP